MTQWSKEDAEKIIFDLKKLAMKDSVFRKMCLANAAAAVKAVSGKELPEGMKVKFIENDGNHMTIVLPDMVDGEMSESDLDSVAGGTAYSFIYSICTCIECN